MPYIVDGHNLIPKIPGINLQMIDDENQLIQVLQDFCRRQQKNVEVFFDGAPAGSESKKKLGRLTVHYVRQGRSADDAIHDRLRKLRGEARNWTVVSSDHAVKNSARQEGAQVLASEDFARQLLQGQDTGNSSSDHAELPIRPEEINEWLEIFEKKSRRPS